MTTQVKSVSGGYATFPNRWFDAGYAAKSPGSITQVYMFLQRWADNSTDEACQAMRMIAAKTGLSEDVARKAVRTLEAWGCLTRHQESGPNAKNVWSLNDLLSKAPDYPDKAPPKLFTTPTQTAPPLSTTPYQPNKDQPSPSLTRRREGAPRENEPEKPGNPGAAVAAGSEPETTARRTAPLKNLDGERNAYFDALVQVFRWTPPQQNVAKAQAVRELRIAFPDRSAIDALPLDRFIRAARSYRNTNKPEFWTVARVIGSMQEEHRAEKQPLDFDPQPFWDAYATFNRYGAAFSSPPPERMKAFLDALVKLRRRHPELTPDQLMNALWEWNRDLDHVAACDSWGQVVNAWVGNGRQDHTAARKKAHR
ncbi:MAG: hypothetical protein ACR2M1_10410 [Gemmatimonadaceae bacterium]